MKYFTLNYAKWRSGGDGNKRVGKGLTKLLNNDGYMCCLGQACLQLNKELKEQDILDEATPGALNKQIEMLNEPGEYSGYNNTNFSGMAMRINDNEDIPVVHRIDQLRDLFNSKGIIMRVINSPFTKKKKQ